MNGAALVAEILKREGTEFLACYPRNPLIEACAALGIRPIPCCQERVGVGMADGYSRIRHGKQNGVFAAQHGPGHPERLCRRGAGLFRECADDDHPACLPQRAALTSSRGFRAAEVAGPATKFAALRPFSAAGAAPHLMRRAYQAMRSCKPGPVMVEVPDRHFRAGLSGHARLASRCRSCGAPRPIPMR